MTKKILSICIFALISIIGVNAQTYLYKPVEYYDKDAIPVVPKIKNRGETRYYTFRDNMLYESDVDGYKKRVSVSVYEYVGKTEDGWFVYDGNPTKPGDLFPMPNIISGYLYVSQDKTYILEVLKGTRVGDLRLGISGYCDVLYQRVN